MIQGVIFDMDGVLIDSMPIWDKVPVWYIESQKKKPEENLAQILYTKSLPEAAEYMRQKYQIPKSAKEILQEIIQIVNHQYEKVIPEKTGARAFLKKLRQDNVPITLATSSERILAQAALKRLGMLQYIQEIFTCRELDTSKESSKIYQEALKKMGTSLENTWVFEDAYHGIETAHKAGFQTVGIYDQSSEQYTERIKKASTIYLSDLKDYNKFKQFVSELDNQKRS